MGKLQLVKLEDVGSRPTKPVMNKVIQVKGGIELCSVNLPLIFTPLALIAGFANTKAIAYFKGLISLLSLLSLNLIFQGFTMIKMHTSTSSKGAESKARQVRPVVLLVIDVVHFYSWLNGVMNQHVGWWFDSTLPLIPSVTMTLIQDALTSSAKAKDPVNLPSLLLPSEISKASRIEGTTLTQAKAIGSKLKHEKARAFDPFLAAPIFAFGMVGDPMDPPVCLKHNEVPPVYAWYAWYGTQRMGVVSEGLLARGSKLIAGGNRLITHALLPCPSLIA
ncbi:9655_t:CDS:2 [Dentiscutata heterogama]|uniref:9655_t:CDS:1 n=1 Tax=Dentiscutata heterogama TaxID=1316150 RepID=A0ACA9KV90_9GLOM|nr:9655_t:CDS:2 [Dentiscutata heterogama]